MGKSPVLLLSLPLGAHASPRRQRQSAQYALLLLSNVEHTYRRAHFPNMQASSSSTSRAHSLQSRAASQYAATVAGGASSVCAARGSRSSVRAIVMSSVKASGDLPKRAALGRFDLFWTFVFDSLAGPDWRLLLHCCSQLCETRLFTFVAQALALPLLAPSSSGIAARAECMLN